MKNSSAQKIGVTTATIVGMNAMIGSGIFTAPATMASNVGPAGIIAYVFVVLAVFFIAQSLARLAYLYPESGSFYSYARHWAGPIIGHYIGLIAIGSYLIGMLIAMGLLAQITGVYMHRFIPTVAPYWLGLSTLIILIILNIFGVKLSKLSQHILIFCTLFPLVAITLMCLSQADIAHLTPFAPYGFSNIFKATRIVIFGFFGFESTASLYNIVKDPERTVPKALTYSIILVGFMYLCFIGSIIISTPLELFTDPKMPLSHALMHLFPNYLWLLPAIDLAILSALLGTIHSLIWTSSNLLMLMTEKIKNKWLITHIISHITHGWSVCVVSCIIMTSYITIKNLDLFFNLTALSHTIAYILALITLLTLPSEWRSGQNIKTIIGLLTSGAMAIFALQGIFMY